MTEHEQPSKGDVCFSFPPQPTRRPPAIFGCACEIHPLALALLRKRPDATDFVELVLCHTHHRPLKLYPDVPNSELLWVILMSTVCPSCYKIQQHR